ncbi:MAG: cytochrome c biogenesis protein CcsA [Promethearchaeota archaeon]
MNYKLKKNHYFLIISLTLLFINLFIIFGLATFSRVVYIIFFYHVSAAWLSYFSFGVSLVSHILYLKQKKMNWSLLGKNSIIVGVFFVAFTLITGSLWFNATSGAYNNIYWQWSDPRQTTTLILLLSYVAYLIFRNFIEEREKRAKLSAILGIVFFPTVPLSYLSAIIFNSLHPLINPNPGEPGNIYWDPIKMFSLFFNLIAITILFIYLVRELKELDMAKVNLHELLQAKMEEGK